VPIEELIIIGHSMGGLVSRSALYYGQKQQNSWTKHLKKIIFLGTPHHGAPMEQVGNYVDVVLEAVPYSKPFARLGKIRSAGVTDLRYGNLLDEDWQNYDRFKMHGDQRQTISLPKQVECYAIAGVIGKAIKSGTRQLLGDNMVGIKSALGQHKDPTKNLNFKKANTWIAYENNHMDLLSNPKVYNKIKTWML
jgi:pimeloyl-ACP methyl ester carboxylesterase